jgi:acyl-[acyl-carrier-protein]-phospholipid O-acyltransferase/long-chain-fatty-acid--[acyl-carrier-protein] ligase
MKTETGYRPLLLDSHFQAFLWTQFLGAFNDNVYKMIVSILAVRIAADSALGARYLAIAGAVFVLPFLLFAGTSGQLADRFSKTRVLQITKAFEVPIMLLGIGALLSGRIEPLLVVLFLLAMQANFFSPAKYGILPETMSEAQLSRANGLLELSTFVAIVIGASFGTLLFEHWNGEPLRMGGTLLGIAIVGSLCSLHIQNVPAAGSSEPFRWNPFQEVIAGSRVLWARKPLFLTVLGISWFWFVGALFQMALLLSGKEVLHVGEAQVGLLVAALAAGIGVGSLLAGSISGNHIELGIVPLGALLMGVSSVALGLTHTYTASLVWLFGVGFSGGLFAVPLNAFLQEEAHADEKGRLIATNNFLNMVGVILASGLLYALHDLLHWSPSAIYVVLGLAMLAGAVYIARLVPDRALRFFFWCVAQVLFKVRIEGAERMPRTGGALIVANHVSYADAILVGMATPRIVRFVLWNKIFNTPGCAWIFEAMRAIPIGIDSPKAAILGLRGAKAAVEGGDLVCIYPEGGITRTGEMQPFERGFLRINNGTVAPIIPVYIDGMFGHPLSYKGGGLFQCMERLWRPEVAVRVGEPITHEVEPAELRQAIIDLGARQGTLTAV